MSRLNFFITGGAGFVGSHVSEQIFNSYPNSKIFIYDKLTYAGNKKYLSSILSNKNVFFIKGDIIDYKKYEKILSKIDIAINIAAESHVDNSFGFPISFTKNNTLGAHIFIHKCIEKNVKKILHVSSDEVYGEKLYGSSIESDPLIPTNPYSASKAAAEMIINSYKYSYSDKIIIVRSNNIYGIRQYPEKLISRTILNLINNKKIIIHGNGYNKRFFLSAKDFANAIDLLISKVNKGIYNIGTEESYSNIKVAKMICEYFNKNINSNIKYTADRPFNDRRYSVNYSKIKKLGWKPKFTLKSELPYIINWYKKNYKIFKKINA